jgi:diguanylate cyclase (GGDEF)-like protein/PAS domain S-box-containing protein
MYVRRSVLSEIADLMKLADLTDDIFIVCDGNGFVRYANAAAERLHGCPDLVNHHISEFIHRDDEGFDLLRQAARSADGRSEGRVIATRCDGSKVVLGVRAIHEKKSDQWFSVARDITESVAREREMEALNERLQRETMTDPLTGVGSRTALFAALDLAVSEGKTFALLMVDMDDFKSVNDTLGHRAGDEFLRRVAQHLKSVVKGQGIVSRFGGDEFIAVLRGVSRHRAVELAECAARVLGRDYAIAGASVTRTCSLGLAMYETGDDANAMLEKADRATYEAKALGRGGLVLYGEGMLGSSKGDKSGSSAARSVRLHSGR